tara:strand:+ start:683 stop:1678 length:996 start_codon:yes stop_codon:yes gene_type:complete
MALNINGTTGISGVDGSASSPALQGTDSNTGINFASDTVNINTGGTTRATVDSNGRLGVGTTPSHPLDIEVASGDAIARVHAAENNSTSDAKLRLEVSNDFAEGIVEAYDSSGIGGSLNYNHGDSAWRFLTSNQERLRIGTSGQIGIGGTNYGSSGQVLTSQGSGSAVQWAAVPAGGITTSDVVSVTKTDIFTTSSGSFTDITGLSVTITPSSSSSKILILGSCQYSSSGSGGSRQHIRLLRGSSAIAIGDGAGSRQRSTFASETSGGGGNMKSAALFHLDSPSTTSATTYKFQAAALDGNSFQLNRSVADTDSSNYQRVASFITVIEVKA